jgi:hypothetical protein
MHMSEFYNPSDDAEIVSFANLATAVEGIIAAEPTLVADKFNPPDGRVLVIGLSTDEGPRKLFARRGQNRAIAAALKAAGVAELSAGGWLRLAYVADQETPNGTAKVYAAEYRPAPEADGPIGTAELGEAIAPWEVQPEARQRHGEFGDNVVGL